MRRSEQRSPRAAWLAAAGTLLVTLGASSTPHGLDAAMGCAVEPGTGRLLCTVTLGAPGRALVWSDALVVAAPPGAAPLRSRVASAQGAPERILIGFVLSAGAGGRIEVLARAVSCPKAPARGACRPASRRVAYELAEWQ